MITNPDGSEYRTRGTVQYFNPNGKESDLFNKWDEEAIRQYGSPVFYYEVFIPTASIDPIYLESRDKIFSNHPRKLYAMYEPIPAQNYSSTMGIDAPDEIVFELNYRAVLREIGHPPKIGSRIFTPHKGENWVIVQRNVGEFKLWGEYRLNLICQRFQENITTGEGRVSQAKPNFKIN